MVKVRFANNLDELNIHTSSKFPKCLINTLLPTINTKVKNINIFFGKCLVFINTNHPFLQRKEADYSSNLYPKCA